MKTTTQVYRTLMSRQFRPRGRIRILLTSGYSTWSFSESDIVRLDAKTSVDPLSRRLPTESLTFSVFDFAGEYDPSNPEGKWNAIDRNAVVSVEYGVQNGASISWLPEADVYILDGKPSWQRGVATFIASSSLLHLTQMYYQSTATATDLYSLTASILMDAGVNYSIWGGLSSIQLNIPLPVDTVRNTLQRIAQANGCALYTRHGTICIQPYEEDDIEDNPYTMTLRDIVQDSDTVTKSNPIYMVQGYQYERQDALQDTIVFQQAIYTIGGETIHIEYEAVADPVLTVSSGTVQSSHLYARGADIVMQDSGVYEITVTGRRIGQSGTLLRAEISDNTEGGTFAINNPLVNSTEQMNNIIYKAANFLRHRITHTMETRGNPDQEPLDGVNFVTEYGFAAHGLILSSEIVFDGVFAGRLEILSLNEGTDGEEATLQDSDNYYVQDSQGDQLLVVGSKPYTSAYTCDDMDDMITTVIG